MVKKNIAVLAGVVALLAIGPAAAEDYRGFQAGDIIVRLRGLAVVPSVSSHVTPIGGTVDASTSFEPEADITYFLTPNIAIEAIAAVTRHHLHDNGSSSGNIDLGKVSLLPPTVTAQYHFLPTAKINPYVGAGINYTVFFDSSPAAGSAATQVEYENRFAPAIQAGADFHIDGNWYANIDVKHIFLTTHASINGGTIGADVSLDPTIVGFGLGYKF
ncbi:MAG: OmpW family protein [Bdellovibrionales bacterium]